MGTNRTNKNIILDTDSYKVGHYIDYVDDTEVIHSYFEFREGADYDVAVFFGLQYILKTYLEGVVVTQEMIEEADELFKHHFGSSEMFNREGWEYIVNVHGGKLPVRIKAAPEGMVVPVSNVLMTVENTDPEVPWLTNYLETLLSRVWYPSTVATTSYTAKQVIGAYLDETAETRDSLPFQLHDFGARGVSSHESSSVGGAAHLVNFLGTDTLNAMTFARDFYDADMESLAFSVKATEHSLMTQLGPSGEYQILDNLLASTPTGILSVVADSYNIYSFVEEVCKRKEQIKERDGVFVVRPDSTTVAHPTPARLTVWIANALYDQFGGTVNSKGFKVLDPAVRILWGDGININDIEDILREAKADGFSAENFVFGMGGGLLQKTHRDVLRSAFKCSAQRRDGEWHDVWKLPLDTSKQSKRGRQSLVEYEGKLMTARADYTTGTDLLETVFENGEILKTYTFDEVRANAEKGSKALSRA